MVRIAIDLDYTLINHTEDGKVFEIHGASGFLKRQVDLGNELVLITARHPNELENVTVICKHFEERVGFKFSGIVFTNGMPKGAYAKRNKCIIMIDDDLHYLSDCKKYGVLPMHFQGSWEVFM